LLSETLSNVAAEFGKSVVPIRLIAHAHHSLGCTLATPAYVFACAAEAKVHFHKAIAVICDAGQQPWCKPLVALINYSLAKVILFPPDSSNTIPASEMHDAISKLTSALALITLTAKPRLWYRINDLLSKAHVNLVLLKIIAGGEGSTDCAEEIHVRTNLRAALRYTSDLSLVRPKTTFAVSWAFNAHRIALIVLLYHNFADEDDGSYEDAKDEYLPRYAAYDLSSAIELMRVAVSVRQVVPDRSKYLSPRCRFVPRYCMMQCTLARLLMERATFLGSTGDAQAAVRCIEDEALRYLSFDQDCALWSYVKLQLAEAMELVVTTRRDDDNDVEFARAVGDSA
jgi:hypothetical protein